MSAMGGIAAAATRSARRATRPNVTLTQHYGPGGPPAGARQQAYNRIATANDAWDNGDNNAYASFGRARPAQSSPLSNMNAQPGVGGARPGVGGGGGVPGIGGAPGAGMGAGAGSGFMGTLQGAYEKLINGGGGILNPSQRAGLLNRTASTVNRGTSDSIQQARMDAARRGDTSGSTLGDTEARIRGQGAANAATARADTDIALSTADANNLQGILQGASGLAQAQGQLGLAGAQLSIQQIQALAELLKDPNTPPEIFGAFAGLGG